MHKSCSFGFPFWIFPPAPRDTFYYNTCPCCTGICRNHDTPIKLWKKVCQPVWEQHALLLVKEQRRDPPWEYPQLRKVGVPHHWNGMDSGWQQFIISFLHYVISTVNPHPSKNSTSLRNRANWVVFIYCFNTLTFKIQMFFRKGRPQISTTEKTETLREITTESIIKSWLPAQYAKNPLNNIKLLSLNTKCWQLTRKEHPGTHARLRVQLWCFWMGKGKGFLFEERGRHGCQPKWQSTISACSGDNCVKKSKCNCWKTFKIKNIPSGLTAKTSNKSEIEKSLTHST